MLPPQGSIHLTVPLPGGCSDATGLYPLTGWWVSQLLKIELKLLLSDDDDLFTFPNNTFIQDMMLLCCPSYLVTVFQVVPLFVGLFGAHAQTCGFNKFPERKTKLSQFHLRLRNH